LRTDIGIKVGLYYFNALSDSLNILIILTIDSLTQTLNDDSSHSFFQIIDSHSGLSRLIVHSLGLLIPDIVNVFSVLKLIKSVTFDPRITLSTPVGASNTTALCSLSKRSKYCLFKNHVFSTAASKGALSCQVSELCCVASQISLEALSSSIFLSSTCFFKSSYSDCVKNIRHKSCGNDSLLFLNSLRIAMFFWKNKIFI
jgi:hypothetical protein